MKKVQDFKTAWQSQIFGAFCIQYFQSQIRNSKAGLYIRIIGGQQAPNLVVFFYDLTRINKVDMVAIVEPRIGEVNTDKVSQSGCSRFLRWFMDSLERHC
jgi:hypothetical protein